MARTKRLIPLALLVLVAFSLLLLPNARAVGNTTYFTNNTTVGTCGTLCKGLTTTSGTLSTATVVSSFVENAVPALDSGASSDKTGTWTSGTTISVTTWATAQTPDTVLVIVASSKATLPIQSAPTTLPSGMTCDASARKEAAGSAALGLSEWVCHTTSTVASTTITCNLSATPTWGICEVIAINGAEDPTGTFSPFDAQSLTTVGFPCVGQRNAGGGTAVPSTATGFAANCSTAGASTSLNANDFWIGISECAATCTNPQTVGNLGAIAATFIHTTLSTGTLSIERRAASATTSAATCATFATADGRWNIFCDALQAKPKYFKVEPETSASLTGTPSVAANGFSGTGWVLNTAGIDSSGLLTTILAGTWVADTKMAIASTTGAPKVFFWWEFWDCTTNSCTTATNIGKDWDTSTAIATSTSQTAFTITSASIGAYTFPSTDFLGIEVWAVLQYSGTTTSTTLTYSTIASATTDFKPSSFAFAKGLAASPTWVSKLKYDYCNPSNGCSLTTIVEVTGTYVAGAATAFTAAIKSALTFSAGRGSLVHFLMALNATLTFAGQRTSGFAFGLSGSLTLAAARAQALAIKRNLLVSLDLVAVRASGFVRGVSGNLGVLAAIKRQLALQDNFPASLTFVAQRTSGLAALLSGSLSLSAARAQQVALRRNLPASITWTSDMTSVTGGQTCHGNNPPKCDYRRTFLGNGPGFTAVRTSGFVRSLSIHLTFGSALLTGQCPVTFCEKLLASFGEISAMIMGHFDNLLASLTINDPHSASFFDNTPINRFTGFSIGNSADCGVGTCDGLFYTESGTTTLSSIKMDVCALGGDPTAGTLYAKLYAGSGSAPNGVGTGPVLAVSGGVDSLTLPLCNPFTRFTTFTFSGANQVTLVDGNTYVFVVGFDTVGGNPILVFQGLRSNNGFPPVNTARDTAGTWDSVGGSYLTSLQVFGISTTTVPTVQVGFVRSFLATISQSASLSRLYAYLRGFLASPSWSSSPAAAAGRFVALPGSLGWGSGFAFNKCHVGADICENLFNLMGLRQGLQVFRNCNLASSKCETPMSQAALAIAALALFFVIGVVGYLMYRVGFFGGGKKRGGYKRSRHRGGYL